MGIFRSCLGEYPAPPSVPVPPSTRKWQAIANAQASQVNDEVTVIWTALALAINGQDCDSDLLEARAACQRLTFAAHAAQYAASRDGFRQRGPSSVEALVS